jgi:hypothetical protein
LELAVAAQNYHCTGLPRYKKTLKKCEDDHHEAQAMLSRHCLACNLCGA